jgi:hypothetical protein
MGSGRARIVVWLAGFVAAAFICGPVAAQQPPHPQSEVKAVTLTSLTEQDFEVKLSERGDA